MTTLNIPILIETRAKALLRKMPHLDLDAALLAAVGFVEDEMFRGHIERKPGLVREVKLLRAKVKKLEAVKAGWQRKERILKSA